MNRIAAMVGIVALLGALPARAADGEVRKIDRAQAKVTIAHGEIKNLGMPAMTMAYRAKPPRLLDGLAVGDRIEFSADKVDGQYVVTAIRKKP
ncbi:copper-binding protein [Ideonella sp.]|uniref:copper-binding protein n=1 Tax=Ideonella sp. TaxID=1929293 RepID=UPI002B4757CA|nr:copper-binding protein [Ideonella sp.]HJV68226.1 copper-binding protein [Ideonella sp.]